MANCNAAKKRTRQNITRTARNDARMSRVRTFVRKVEQALANGNAAEAKEALKNAQPELMRAVSKGVIKKETASRKLSRLAQRAKKLAA
jgi:small subunit ribosomal protein S20